MTHGKRRSSQTLRPTRLVRSCLRLPAGSALIQSGNTQVLCSASVEGKVPGFLRGSGKGWVTAEYGMLPGSVQERIPRGRTSGREMEISRLIGRSLRSIIDLTCLGEITITLDCDVLDADGGTRTAAINAAYVALREAVDLLRSEERIAEDPFLDSVAAISVGRVGDGILLDLCYEEDSAADVDFNVVATGSGRLVEVQGTAEAGTFSEEEMQRMVSVALAGIAKITRLQERCLSASPKPAGILLRGRE